MVKTIIVGLDGANWHFLDPWLREDDLSNIISLNEEGIKADHHSVLPPVTSPNWRAYSTGKNPGKLGVFWFEKINTKTRSLSLPNSKSFKSQDIWDYFNDEGHSCAVLNLPMTFPPQKIDSVMVAGGPRSAERNFTFPPALEPKLETKFNYRVHPKNVITSNENADEEVKQIHDLIDTRFKMAKYIADEYDPDVLHLTIFYINVLQHYFWREDPVKEAWKIIDNHIGDLAPRAENVVLLSDHGCYPVDSVFYVNAWLKSEGYLSTKTTATDYLYKAGITQERLAKLARMMRLEEPIRRLMTQQMMNWFPDSEGTKRHQKLKKVDWENSSAIASGQGPIYLTLDNKDPKYETVRDELITKLESLTDPRNGQKIARKAYRAEEVYEGPYLSEGPDLIFDQEPGVHTSGAVGTNEPFQRRGEWKAENVRTGLFLASGPNFETGELEETISITDIAPTILHASGLAVPEDMDGDVLNVFQPDSEPARREVKYRDPLDHQVGAEDDVDEEIARERLKDIGYLE